MKWLFTLVTWIALAIAAAWFLDNSAMVSVFANGMRIDFSLNLLVIATLLGAWLILTIYRVRHRLGRMVREAKANRAQQAERDLMGLVMEALSLQLAGRHGRAQAIAQQAIERLADQSLPMQSTALVLAHWVCAESAQAMRQSEQVQHHLDAALAVTAKGSGVVAQEGVRLRSIRWALITGIRRWRGRVWSRYLKRYRGGYRSGAPDWTWRCSMTSSSRPWRRCAP